MMMKINPINVRLRIRLSSCTHARTISSVPRPFTVSRFHCTASLTVPWDGCTEHETHTAHTKIPNDLRRKLAERCQHARCRREASQVLAASLVGLHPGTQVSHNAGKCTGNTHWLCSLISPAHARDQTNEQLNSIQTRTRKTRTHARNRLTYARRTIQAVTGVIGLYHRCGCPLVCQAARSPIHVNWCARTNGRVNAGTCATVARFRTFRLNKYINKCVYNICIYLCTGRNRLEIWTCIRSQFGKYSRAHKPLRCGGRCVRMDAFGFVCVGTD